MFFFLHFKQNKIILILVVHNEENRVDKSTVCSLQSTVYTVPSVNLFHI